MIRIAIVDDHEMVREGLRTILQPEEDFDVVAESGSADGIVALVDDAHPDVVLLDARLPGISGPEATRLLAGVEGIAQVVFTAEDVIRHELVARIVAAYDAAALAANRLREADA